MDDACRRAEVNEPVQELPPLASQSPDPLFRRGDSKRNEHNEARVSGHDEWTLRQVVDHSVESEELVEPDVAHEMQYTVEEREESQHPARPDNFVPLRKSANRCDRQRDKKKAQRPDAGRVSNRLEWICTEIACSRRVNEKGQRQRAEQKHIKSPINNSCVNPFP